MSGLDRPIVVLIIACKYSQNTWAALKRHAEEIVRNSGIFCFCQVRVELMNGAIGPQAPAIGWPVYQGLYRNNWMLSTSSWDKRDWGKQTWRLSWILRINKSPCRHTISIQVTIGTEGRRSTIPIFWSCWYTLSHNIFGIRTVKPYSFVASPAPKSCYYGGFFKKISTTVQTVGNEDKLADVEMEDIYNSVLLGSMAESADL